MNIIRTAFSNEYSQLDLLDKTAIYGTGHILRHSTHFAAQYTFRTLLTLIFDIHIQIVLFTKICRIML